VKKSTLLCGLGLDMQAASTPMVGLHRGQPTPVPETGKSHPSVDYSAVATPMGSSNPFAPSMSLSALAQRPQTPYLCFFTPSQT